MFSLGSQNREHCEPYEFCSEIKAKRPIIIRMGQHVSILITCRATGVRRCLIDPDSEKLDCGVEDSDNEHEPEPILFSILSYLSSKASSRSDIWPRVELMWVSCPSRKD